MNHLPFRFLSGLVAVWLSTTSATATVRLPAILSDHLVLQAEHPIPIWGWAHPGEPVQVSIAGQTSNTQTDENGHWQLQLPALPANPEPQTLTVIGSNTLTVNDVLIGEVWLASGQSNMAFRFDRGEYPASESAAATLPQIRMFTVKGHATRIPQKDCEGSWIVASPQTVQAFSAVAWFFGKSLHEKLRLPVGLINSSWGGTDIAAWTSEPAQLTVPTLKTHIEAWNNKAESFDETAALTAHKERLATWKTLAEKAKAAGKEPPRAPRYEPHPDVYQNRPANLFNGMIAPLVPFSLRGAIWYQGEHNCATQEKASLYATQLPLLIKDWRNQWQSNFPFAWVQLPNFEQTGFRPLVREAMLKSLTIPNTGMAVTIDVGEANDNHPKDKKTVGERLSLWAQARVYRQKIPAFAGPLPAGHVVKGSAITLKFDHTQGGLHAKGENLTGFLIAAADQQWKPAIAKIDGNKVVVSHPDLTQPVAVRYSWAANPDGNLYNGENLPASPFRTDDW